MSGGRVLRFVLFQRFFVTPLPARSTPVSTVPAPCHRPIGSSSSHTLSTLVEMGPSILTCTPSDEPMRATAWPLPSRYTAWLSVMGSPRGSSNEG